METAVANFRETLVDLSWTTALKIRREGGLLDAFIAKSWAAERIVGRNGRGRECNENEVR